MYLKMPMKSKKKGSPEISQLKQKQQQSNTEILPYFIFLCFNKATYYMTVVFFLIMLCHHCKSKAVLL